MILRWTISNRGYRRIVLQPIGHIETQVISICDEENRPLSGSSGYH
jgi:hypothetical protein